jgi:enoyl-CoA hydratase/carnithine racemase
LTPAIWWDHVITDAKYLIMNHLDVEAPMIAAVNGPALIHAELALLCDIVLASETAVFQDLPHFPSGLVPGDGVHVVFPEHSESAVYQARVRQNRREGHQPLRRRSAERV